MARGRKPKPTTLKILDGARPDRLNLDEPAAPPGRPEPPDHLDGNALAEWERVCSILGRMGLLSAADGPALEVHCTAYSRKRAALASRSRA